MALNRVRGRKWLQRARPYYGQILTSFVSVIAVAGLMIVFLVWYDVGGMREGEVAGYRAETAALQDRVKLLEDRLSTLADTVRSARLELDAVQSQYELLAGWANEIHPILGGAFADWPPPSHVPAVSPKLPPAKQK